LARAVRLDLVNAGWRPTVDNYFGRVSKGRILEAVREAKGEQSAQLIDHLKKGEMAKEAERLLEGTGWLPEPLRPPDVDSATEPTAEAETDGDALPAFLTEDDHLSDADEDEPQPIAAQ
jgi:ParB family chromosome partitioning protein